MLLQDWIEQAYTSFPDQQCARYEARLIAQQITQQSPSDLRHKPYELSEAELHALDKLAVRREQGIPLAYLIGWQPFYDLELLVTPDTLIPRGDTEFVVEQALIEIKHCTNPVIADLGTGSGAIALAIAKKRPDAKVIAVDNSYAALEIARRNAEFNHITNVWFVCGHWLDALKPASIDYVIANPPYIAPDDPHLADLQFEPLMALVSQDNGLADIKHIFIDSPRVLKPSGRLLIEHGYNQGESVREIANQVGNWTDITTFEDYGQQPRMTMATLIETSYL